MNAKRTLSLTLAPIGLLVIWSCGPIHNFVSPTTEQGPAPFVGPPEPPEDAVETRPVHMPLSSSATQAAPAAPLVFFRTQSSDEWVTHTFDVQAKYRRVIVVGNATPAPKELTFPHLALNLRGGEAAHLVVKVDANVATLQDAADLAQGGDLVAVLPGTYEGFTLGDKADAGDGAYIHFRAMGNPGEVVIDRATPSDHNWMISLVTAHHVILEGFSIAGPNQPGKPAVGPNAGIYINGDFVKSSKLAHHIAILGVWSHDHKKWGLHSVDSRTVLIQDSVFSGSAMEHAAYVSDGSDDYVIRRNVFMNGPASGLQCNVDPLASLEKLRDHPALDKAPPYKQTREWALAILRLASDKFGANNFPDGRGFNFIIEENVVSGVGKNGGGAINLAGVRESLIQNNVIYGNLSSGIVEWDNNNPYDAAYVQPGPRTPADVTGPEALPLFGCFSNLVRNNTVLMRAKGRPAFVAGSGSWGTRLRNNVLVNDLHPSVEVHTTAIWRFEADRNVLNTVGYEDNAAGFKGLAISLPDSAGSATGITRARLAPHLVRPSEEPWLLFDKGWWKLNPQRPDFHPRAGSALLTGTGDPKEEPALDLEGKKRTTADIGAFAAASTN